MRLPNLDRFIERMDKCGVKLQLGSNAPWLYIEGINGNKVKEKFNSEWGFVLGYFPISPDDNEFKFSDIKKIFEVIRKYK